MINVPIVFAFDNNLIKPAKICISSLLINAKDRTFYDIYVLFREGTSFDTQEISCIEDYYSNCKVTCIGVGNEFDDSYQIRGITTPAYYRLLIPELLPQYDKILYSDVDVIFRSDLSELYSGIDIGDYYFAGVDSMAHLIPDLKSYYELVMEMRPEGIIYSGNLILNSKKIREDGIVDKFREHIDRKYKFQDMDIINIVCNGKIKYLPPSFCYTTYISDLAVNNRELLKTMWTEEQIQEAQAKGIVHYNGQKPWKGACINFDIWWEYYRKSPFFDPKYYYQFFNNMLNEHDRLSLLKRIKILLRYFVYGRKK